MLNLSCTVKDSFKYMMESKSPNHPVGIEPPLMEEEMKLRKIKYKITEKGSISRARTETELFFLLYSSSLVFKCAPGTAVSHHQGAYSKCNFSVSTPDPLNQIPWEPALQDWPPFSQGILDKPRGSACSRPGVRQPTQDQAGCWQSKGPTLELTPVTFGEHKGSEPHKSKLLISTGAPDAVTAATCLSHICGDLHPL